MYDKLVSVIMSTYNESCQEIALSVGSILEQTYNNLELIIVVDNPENAEVNSFLSTINDNRVIILHNAENIGLVRSLNKALSYAHGEIIVRMDADDIALKNRIQKQLMYMNTYKLDMIGCDIQTIDKDNRVLIEKIHFPRFERKLKLCTPYGNCIPHPTWVVRKKVYRQLQGYRMIANCEDYDFVLRVIESKQFHIGNMPDIGLQYRIRENSISQLNKVDQYIIRNYLSKNRKRISKVSENEVMTYIDSNDFVNKRKEYIDFLNVKRRIKTNININDVILLIANKYFYKYMIEKIFYYWRSI